MTKNNTMTIFDEQAALERVAGDIEFLNDLIGTFLEVCDSMAVEMREAIRRRDSATLRRVAHTLKSNAATLCSQTTADAALGLEEIGEHDRLADAADRLRELEGRLAELQAALRAHLCCFSQRSQG